MYTVFTHHKTSSFSALKCIFPKTTNGYDLDWFSIERFQPNLLHSALL